mmetsp:Transcript_37403/g.68719  ORF Transcript_37403/g.68719 Transcript_37403/m.68719 type:complete len:223 (-) Transcript_37403:1605-2273(-)
MPWADCFPVLFVPFILDCGGGPPFHDVKPDNSLSRCVASRPSRTPDEREQGEGAPIEICCVGLERHYEGELTSGGKELISIRTICPCTFEKHPITRLHPPFAMELAILVHLTCVHAHIVEFVRIGHILHLYTTLSVGIWIQQVDIGGRGRTDMRRRTRSMCLLLSSQTVSSIRFDYWFRGGRFYVVIPTATTDLHGKELGRGIRELHCRFHRLGIVIRFQAK